MWKRTDPELIAELRMLLRVDLQHHRSAGHFTREFVQVWCDDAAWSGPSGAKGYNDRKPRMTSNCVKRAFIDHNRLVKTPPCFARLAAA